MLKKLPVLLSALILFLTSVSATGTQQKDNALLIGGRQEIVKRMMQRFIAQKNPARTMTSQTLATQAIATYYEIGTYPGGTWANINDINDSGVVVGSGDILGGWTRPIGVPLLGPNAWQWFDLGLFNNASPDMTGGCSEISDAGMIVGYAATEQGYLHAFAWMPKSGTQKVDLGTLKLDGLDTYDTSSFASGVNRDGTFIVGCSRTDDASNPGSLVGMQTPVVWTPTVVRKAGKPVTVWKINQLPTGGMEQPGFILGVTLNVWSAITVNNKGQIIGVACEGSKWPARVVVVWNPLPGGKTWEIMSLPLPTGFPYAEVTDINNKGEAVGTVADSAAGSVSQNFHAALWKPIDSLRRTYSLTLLPTLTGAPNPNVAFGINDLGDIVGNDYNAGGWGIDARWSTNDPTFVQAIGIAGYESFGWAWKVNNQGIAVGVHYDQSDGFSVAHQAAVKFR